MHIPRIMERTLLEKSKLFPAILLTGPRQVGKTTLLRRLAEKGRTFVSLDELDVRRFAQTDPRLFLATYKPPVLIDEIQYAPELLPYIKRIIDEARFNDSQTANGLFWMTGSQRFHLMSAVGESLAGRIGVYELPGITARERQGRLEEEAFLPSRFHPEPRTAAPEPERLFKDIWLGNCPELVVRGESFWQDFHSSYVQTYLERDVRALAQVADLSRFHDFVRSVAMRTAQLVNYAAFARDAGISQPTAKSWLGVLEASGLVRLIYPYAGNRVREMIRTPKLYVCDTGLAAYLTRWTSAEALQFGAMAGAFFETWCVNEIVNSHLNLGARPSVFFYRDKHQREIDLLIEDNGTLHPVEIKKGARLDAHDVRCFRLLDSPGAPVGTGALVSQYPQVSALAESALAIPASRI